MARFFSEQWIDELRSRIDIVDLISHYVPLTQKSGRFWGLCPFHGEKTASFSVNPQRQMYYCFGCHASGTAINFVMEMEHMSFPEALTQLAEQVHMELPEEKFETREGISKDQKNRLYDANRACALFYHRQLWEKKNEHILAYLHNRGLSDSTIRKFGLGAAPADGREAIRVLTAQGFTEDELVLCGIAVRRDNQVHDMFRNRAIFPIIDGNSRVLGFGGRTLGDAKPKYLNTGDTPIFNKRKGVYAHNLLHKQHQLKRVILTEGYMDVIAMVQAGLTGICATLGTALTQEQARLIKRYAPEVWVSYDGDSAGQHAILRALDIFDLENIPAKVLDYPDGMDPDEYIRTYGSQGIESLQPTDAILYRMKRESEKHDMTTQEGKTEYAIACSRFLTKVREPVQLENYVQRLVVETGFSRDVLLAQIGRTESLPPEKQATYRRSARPLDEQSPDYHNEVDIAELQLLALLAGGSLQENVISAQDFIREDHRDLASALLSGENANSVLERMPDVERGKIIDWLEHDLAPDPDRNLQAANDCLRKLHEKKLDMEIDHLNEELSSASNSNQLDIIKQIMSLQDKKRQLRKE